MRSHILVPVSFLLILTSFAEEPLKTPPPTPPVTTTQTATVAGPTKPAPQFTLPKPPSPEWVGLLDRLKIQPRAGDINNGTVSASVADIFSDSADVKAKATALSSEYEKALIEKASKWESELKEMRAQYEAKMIAELPETKRESAQKFVDMSRAKWTDAVIRDAKTRVEYLERMRNGTVPPAQNPKTATLNGQAPIAPPPPKYNAEASAWMREERMKAMKQDDESAKSLRDLLTPEDAARFDLHNRIHPMVSATPTKKPATLQASPSTKAPAPNVQPPIGTADANKTVDSGKAKP